MCLILFAYKIHPDYQLILAANRDEFYARPTARAGFWQDAPEILAGRDLEQGGTWLGTTRAGRIAAITNFRDPSRLTTGAPSRGLLVSEFLRGSEPARNYLQTLSASAEAYNGFNLLAGDGQNLCYYSNRDGAVRDLPPGLYGLSNHLLDTAWPKVERGKRALSELIARQAFSTDELFGLLADRARADDSRLPQTGVGLELERTLSPLFIVSPAYGTRCSTVLLMSNDGRVQFIERTFAAGSESLEESRFEFQIETRAREIAEA